VAWLQTDVEPSVWIPVALGPVVGAQLLPVLHIVHLASRLQKELLTIYTIESHIVEKSATYSPDFLDPDPYSESGSKFKKR
jgi:hypothetical protein